MKFLIFLSLQVLCFTCNIHSFLIIGHRGACGYEPENTLISFERAVKMGVDMIELDVYVCKTGELVVHHDDDVERMTNGHGSVVDMTFQELRNLRINGKEQIPTLQEVVELINRRIPINIELKGPRTAKPVAQLIQKYLQQGWKYSDFLVSSFDHTQAAEFKKLCPQIATGVLFSWWKMSIDLIRVACNYEPKDIIVVGKKAQADFVGFDVKSVTNDLIIALHHAGFSVFVWTINDKATADAMRAMQVDGIFANYPDQV